jgi:hypothetical protein
MPLIQTTPCPYCAATNQFIASTTGFFRASCFSCTCEFGVEVILPDYLNGFKVKGKPEKLKIK